MKKLLAFGVILMFLGVACSPSIYADESIEQQANNIIYSKDDKLISLPVREYKPDGTIREYFVELTQAQYDEMTGRLQTAKDLDERLSIYKDYRVVPEDVTSESLRAGMEEKAQRFGLDKKMDKMMYEKKNLLSIFESPMVHYNYLCSVRFYFWTAISPSLGLSVLTSRLNNLITYITDELILLLYYYGKMKYLIPSIDLMTLCAGLSGLIHVTNGSMPDFKLGGGGYIWPTFNGFVFMVGFVGYCMAAFPILPMYRFYVTAGYTFFIYTLGVQ